MGMAWTEGNAMCAEILLSSQSTGLRFSVTEVLVMCKTAAPAHAHKMQWQCPTAI